MDFLNQEGVQAPSIPLKKIIKEFHLEVLAGEEYVEETMVSSAEVNRPGLQLIGFLEYSDAKRIQIMGNVEHYYLDQHILNKGEEGLQKIEDYFSMGFPCLIITRSIETPDEFLEVARRMKKPVLRTDQATSRFMSALISYLNVELAPRISVHAVLIEVYGEGMLIMGESGVGKSETAMELVKRGHRLVADDVVEIRKVSDKTVVGTSPDQIRHFIEIRGIGIVDVKELFGMGAVKLTERVDIIIKLENWQAGKEYERLGMKTQYENILGVKIPSQVIPVKPGRNLAIILEVASMNNRQKKMGYNAAEYLNNKLMNAMGFGDNKEPIAGTQSQSAKIDVFNPKIEPDDDDEE